MFSQKSKQRIISLIVALMCILTGMSVFATEETAGARQLAIEGLQASIAGYTEEIAALEAEEITGYEKYVRITELEGLIGDAESAVADLEEMTDEEYAAVLDDEASAELMGFATSYLDGYDGAIQGDADIAANTDEAIAKVREENPFYASIWSILPAIIAIVLALITKEVYSSLFVGIVVGGLLYANFNFEKTINHVVQDGFIGSLADSYNVGILIFLVLLGTLVAMMNKAGGSAAFGRWASTHIKSKAGVQLATVLLGCLIFVDDYFNCLTVGSVMRPVSDAKKISRAKLAYFIDATAAPICIIAPISSWAAAVAGFASDGEGLSLFIKAIPFNFYAILTIVMMVAIILMKFDYGPMKTHEDNANNNGDIFTTLKEKTEEAEDIAVNEKGKVIDLVLPVVVLIICCVIGMIYSGGFFAGENFIDAFSNCDASVGLALGSFAAIVLVAVYFIVFRHGLIKFTKLMGCIPEGFKAMVPAILILTCAWTLKAMTDSLGVKVFIADFVNTSAGAFMNFLPAIIFLIAVGLSFATGTSWGTFGILIPIVLAIFPEAPMSIIGMSACMAGAVCGDHCSPISDTTIMASAGAQCDHVNHVSTQLPYALTVAAVSFVSFLIAGFVHNAFIVLPIAIVLMLATLFVLKAVLKKNK